MWRPDKSNRNREREKKTKAEKTGKRKKIRMLSKKNCESKLPSTIPFDRSDEVYPSEYRNHQSRKGPAG